VRRLKCAMMLCRWPIMEDAPSVDITMTLRRLFGSSAIMDLSTTACMCKLM
jgi:hypothetical protein